MKLVGHRIPDILIRRRSAREIRPGERDSHGKGLCRHANRTVHHRNGCVEPDDHKACSTKSFEPPESSQASGSNARDFPVRFFLIYINN